MSILFGLAAIIFGAWGMWIERHAVILMLEGFLPLGFLLAGLILLIAGVARLGSPKRPPPTGSDVEH